GNADRFRRAIHVVAAGAAVTVNIHQSGTDVAVCRVNDLGADRQHYVAGTPNGDNPFVFDDHRALRQNLSRQNHSAAKYDAWHGNIASSGEPEPRVKSLPAQLAAV